MLKWSRPKRAKPRKMATPKEVEPMQGEANIALDAEDQSRARRMMPSPWPYDLAARRQARIDLEQEERNARVSDKQKADNVKPHK